LKGSAACKIPSRLGLSHQCTCIRVAAHSSSLRWHGGQKLRGSCRGVWQGRLDPITKRAAHGSSAPSCKGQSLVVAEVRQGLGGQLEGTLISTAAAPQHQVQQQVCVPQVQQPLAAVGVEGQEAAAPALTRVHARHHAWLLAAQVHLLVLELVVVGAVVRCHHHPRTRDGLRAQRWCAFTQQDRRCNPISAGPAKRLSSASSCA